MSICISKHMVMHMPMHMLTHRMPLERPSIYNYGHNYIGHTYIGHNCIRHNASGTAEYTRPSLLGHHCICHNCICHNASGTAESASATNSKVPLSRHTSSYTQASSCSSSDPPGEPRQMQQSWQATANAAVLASHDELSGSADYKMVRCGVTAGHARRVF